MISSIFKRILILIDYCLEAYWAKNGDPRVKSYPLMKSFGPVLIILTFYSVFVLWIGPRFMRNREPFSLKPILVVYNITMSIVNLYLFLNVLFRPRLAYEGIIGLKLSSFTEVDDDELTHIWYAQVGYMSRFVDLLDTIFFVLRKKQSQVTFLHFYHHFSVVFFGWMYLRLNACCYFLSLAGLINTFIHVVMYAYYCLAALGPEMQPYLWWKRYITQLQLAQFVIGCFHSTYFVFYQKGHPPFLVYNYLAQALIYFVLFSNFYIQTYVLRKETHLVKSNNFKKSN